MSRHFTRLALESSIVRVDGMFEAQFLKEGHFVKSVEALETAHDALDQLAADRGVVAFYDGQKTLSQVALEGFKDVLRKIWELIVKAVAAYLSLTTGLISWLMGSRKRRGLTNEIYRVYLNMSGILLSSTKRAFTLADGIMSGLKVDKKLDVLSTDIFHAHERLHMVDSEAYTKVVRDLILRIVEPSYAQEIKDLAEGIGRRYQDLRKQAEAIDETLNAQGGEGKNALVPVSGSMEEFIDTVDRQLLNFKESSTFKSVFTDVTDCIAQIAQLVEKAKSTKVEYSMDYMEMTTSLSRFADHFPVEKVEEATKTYTKIFEDTKKSLVSAEQRFDQSKFKRLDDYSSAPAQTYLDKAVLQALRDYGNASQTLAKAIGQVDIWWNAGIYVGLKKLEVILFGAIRFAEDSASEGNSVNATVAERLVSDLKKSVLHYRKEFNIISRG